jgi:hypothetical protein
MATPINIFRGALPTTGTTLATVPAGETWIVTHIALVGTSTSNPLQRVNLNFGGVAFLIQQLVSFTDTLQVDTKAVLVGGDTIAGLTTTANSCSAHISGVRL